jgi:hypothetical protein
MLRRWRCVFLVTLVAGLLATSLLAQKAPKVKYDPATEVKMSGTIEEVKNFECPVSGTMGFHIVLRSGGQTQIVHVAASKFMKDYEIVFEKGERIEVLGSKVKLESGEDAILAREITRGQNTYAFRDKQGKPLW